MARRVSPKQDLPGTILAEGVTVSTDMHETQLNNNVVVFGTPGGGKTEGVVKPNVMQLNSSYVITDPKGNLCDELGPMLRAAGYKVQRLDLVRPGMSNGYNPFAYLRNDDDVDFFVEALINSTGRFSRDPFWDDSTAVLFKALIGYLRAMREIAENDDPITMRELVDLLDEAFFATDGRGANCRNALDDAFERLRTGIKWDRGNPVRTHAPYRGEGTKAWQRFKQLAPAVETTACIYMEAAGKLTHLANSGVLSILDGDYDPIRFEDIGKRKTALFVVVSDTD